MKSILQRLLLPILLLSGFGSTVQAQPFSVNWFKVAGGGGSSSSAQFSISGTAGQADAGTVRSGGNFSLVTGYWSVLSIATPGAPALRILRTTTNAVVVTWPAPSAGYVLQNVPALTGFIWQDVPTTPFVADGLNQVVVSPPTGNRFYRLKK
jgi:hypothetical protein